MMNPLISIIIPVHNTEQYLNRCIDSIVNQSYTHLEIILVENGSSDCCGMLCDEWAQRDERIRVLHIKESCAANARNAGLDIAKGEWIYFADSDDVADEHIIEELFNTAVSENVSVCACGYTMVYPRFQRCIVPDIHQSVSSELCLEMYYGYFGYYSILWNKLFKRDLFNHTRLKQISVFEDAEILFRIFCSVDKLAIVDKPLYHYYIRSDSLSNGAFNVDKLVVIDVMKEQLQYCLAHSLKTAFENNNQIFVFRLRCAYRCAEKYLCDKRLMKRYKKDFRCYFFKYLLMLRFLSIPIAKRELIKNLIFFVSPTIFRMFFPNHDDNL